MRLITAIIVLVCLAACHPPLETVTIEFEARLGDRPIDCETTVDGVAMTDLRFFVSGPVLFAADPQGTSDDAASLRLAPNGRWQQAGLVLIDLENGQGACENGTPETNSTLTGRVPAGDYRGLAFWMAVPFEVNHSDPLAAAPPLDDSTMHWHWRSGYKFLRAGFETDDDGFWMHVGSAGCEGTVQRISGCRWPNRAWISVSGYEPGDRVIFDFAPLIGAVDTGDAVPSDCSSGPAEETCGEPFRVLGLDFDSGETAYPSLLFRAASP